MPDGQLWLIRDRYAAETVWAPRHVGKELRLSRLGVLDAGLGAIRADAEGSAARKAGDQVRAGRYETLAASYRALRDHYQQREHSLAQAMADRQEWEHLTEQSRRLAIASDAELRRRHPDRKIEPLRAADQHHVSDNEHDRLHPARDGKLTEPDIWLQDLTAHHKVFRARMNERQRLTVLRLDPDWADLVEISSSLWTQRRDAILQSPKPEIIPSARILQPTAEHDLEFEAAD